MRHYVASPSACRDGILIFLGRHKGSINLVK